MNTILLRASAIILFIVLSSTAVPAHAASARPECRLIVSTPRGYGVYEKTDHVEIRSGERVILGWIGVNASTGTDRDKKSIPLVGLSVLEAAGSGTYTYTFREGRRSVTCSASLTLAGTSSDSSSADESTSSGGSVSVSAIPLLSGGVAALGASVPVSYIKVYNPSTEPAVVNGFTLTQNGSADADVVIGFSTNDDKGGSRATIGGTEGTKLFKNGKAFVPLKASIGPGKFSIFTIKAQLSRIASGDAGKSLMLDVASIDTTASIRGTFPIRGTTWTLNF